MSDYTAPGSTQVTDSTPPYEAHVNPLPAARLAPFTVHWGGSDACSGVTTYDVEYNVGGGAWQPWLTGTVEHQRRLQPRLAAVRPNLLFPCPRPRSGRQYRRLVDAGQHPPGPLHAQRQASLTVREEPIAGALVTLTPAALAVEPRPGGYLAYLAGDGLYDVWAGRAGFDVLPPMLDVAVAGDVSGVDLFLPPLDDAVTDGGFEAGNLAAWQTGGTVSPTLTAVAHTGAHSVQMGDVDRQLDDQPGRQPYRSA